MNFYWKLFAGTYFLLIKLDNKGVLVYSSSCAFTSVFAMGAFHVTGVAALVIFIDRLYWLENTGVNFIFVILFVLGGWLAFIRGDKYKKVIESKKADRASLIRLSAVVYFVMAFALVVAVAAYF